MIKKIIRHLLTYNPVEHINPKDNSLWARRIREDHITRYLFALKYIKRGRVLDIACGEGYGSALLAKSAQYVTGVDMSAQTIKEAKSKYYQNNKNIKFITDNALHFLKNCNQKYDVIVSFETIEHLTSYRDFLILLKKCLKRSGILIISTPNKLFSDLIAGDTFNPFHIKEFYTQELIDLVTSVFKTTPSLFLQRPVMKGNLLINAARSFFFTKKSLIISNDNSYEGLDIILVIQKTGTSPKKHR